MDSELKKEVLRLAREVRRWGERREPDNEDLGGACFDCSARLLVKMQQKGMFPTLVWSTYGHAFIRYYGHIIDVTATQFGVEEEVCIVKANTKKAKEPWWRMSEKYKTIEDYVKRNQRTREGRADMMSQIIRDSGLARSR